jgi:hypothetical protein
MEVSGQLHASAILAPEIHRGLGSPQRRYIRWEVVKYLWT